MSDHCCCMHSFTFKAVPYLKQLSARFLHHWRAVRSCCCMPGKLQSRFSYLLWLGLYLGLAMQDYSASAWPARLAPSFVLSLVTLCSFCSAVSAVRCTLSRSVLCFLLFSIVCGVLRGSFWEHSGTINCISRTMQTIKTRPALLRWPGPVHFQYRRSNVYLGVSIAKKYENLLSCRWGSDPLNIPWAQGNYGDVS